MTSRGTIIVALLAVEVAIVGEAVAAIQGGGPRLAYPHRTIVSSGFGSHLVEDGPHQIFDVGEHPALTVDIGYADLTVRTSPGSQIDVSLSASQAFGIFRAKAPIGTHKDGETIRISSKDERGWSVGDDRMVTVIVPPETQLTVVKAGDIKVEGLRAEATLNSVGSGTITVEDYDAPALHVATSNGLIDLHQIVAARLIATSKNDRVEGTALQVRDGNVESDGRVTLGFATGADTVVNAEASNGRISVSGFPGVSSGTTGRKHGDDDDDGPSAQTVRVGDGSGRLDVRSSDGNIELTQDG